MRLCIRVHHGEQYLKSQKQPRYSDEISPELDKQDTLFPFVIENRELQLTNVTPTKGVRRPNVSCVKKSHHGVMLLRLDLMYDRCRFIEVKERRSLSPKPVKKNKTKPLYSVL